MFGYIAEYHVDISKQNSKYIQSRKKEDVKSGMSLEHYGRVYWLTWILPCIYHLPKWNMEVILEDTLAPSN